ncbi:MAG: hypothetical protein M0C28_40575 [Candidatus Moduliflexus flocculans]|nr:hypothetical protein [Candidatus Moduliflexus flocculans]
MNRLSWLENRGDLGISYVRYEKRRVVALALVLGLLLGSRPGPGLRHQPDRRRQGGDGEALFRPEGRPELRPAEGVSEGRRADGAGPTSGVQATIRALRPGSRSSPRSPSSRPRASRPSRSSRRATPALDPYFADPDQIGPGARLRRRPRAGPDTGWGGSSSGPAATPASCVSAREKFRAERPSGEDLIFATRCRGGLPGPGLRAAPRGVLDDHPAAPRRRARLPPPLAGGAGRYPPGRTPGRSHTSLRARSGRRASRCF